MSSVSKSSVTVCSSSTVFLSSSVSSSSKVSIPLTELSDRFLFSLSVTVSAAKIFQKSFSAKIFLQALVKIFLEFDFSMNGFSSKIIFLQERGNHKLKKVHVVLFQNLRFSKILKFEMVSNSDLYFIQCKIWGVGKFHQQAILCVQRADKICACDLLRRSVFLFSAFCALKVEIEKNFLSVL